MNTKITRRQEKEKKLLIEQLRKTPVIQVACQKTDISRATFYRWKNDDEIFAREADEALQEGSLLVNDMAESQLINLIKEGNLGAMTFWLKSHHSSYATKVDVTAHLKQQTEVLTPEQEALINKALQLASLIENKKEEENETI